jgi:hypothetical protein
MAQRPHLNMSTQATYSSDYPYYTRQLMLQYEAGDKYLECLHSAHKAMLQLDPVWRFCAPAEILDLPCPPIWTPELYRIMAEIRLRLPKLRSGPTL